jgi:hypothetical protein
MAGSVRPLLIALLLAAPAFAQANRGNFPTEISTKHYIVKSTATKEEAQELGEFMEIVFSTYTSLLRPETPVDNLKFTVILYKNNAEYVGSGAPRGSGAYYSPREKLLVGYHDEFTMRNFFAHEGMHQFTDVTSKNFMDLPFWFIEGVADCIGNSIVKEKKLFMCVKTGVIARMRLPLIQEAIKSGKAYKWRDLFALGQQKFMADAGLCYAQSWSICHFLMAYPNFEDKTSQIPNGTFRKNFAIYYETLRKGGANHQKAWEEAFKDAPPADKLEEMWKSYILKMDSGKYLGFSGKDIEDKEADDLNLGEKFSGIKVENVVKDSVGEKAGLKEGDIIVKFDGKKLPRGSALDKLKLWMQDIPFGRPTKITVLRNKEEVELKTVWEKKKDN